ncbi:MAG: FixH family protein [Proteobacteria bacterium]|nr:FixH family protein [Pseudomonadota bacterium]
MSTSKPIHRGPNAAVILAIALPAFAVLASVGTAWVAMTSGDPPLPGQYHWEGDRLDHDFADAHRAAALGLAATLDLQPAQGACHLTLQLASDMPTEVALDVISASRPELDRQMRFVRDRSSGNYTAACTPLPAGSWHLELRSSAGEWSYRQDWTGGAGRVTLASAVQ